MSYSRRDVRKGDFVIGAAQPAFVKRGPPLPDDLAEFESAVVFADQLTAQGFRLVEDRLEVAERRLEEIRAMVRR